MIDIRLEKLVTLADAAPFCPRRRHQKRPHPSTLSRWGRHGINGIRLETLRVGATTCTTVEALQRFFERLEAAARALEAAPISTVAPRSGNTQVEAHLDALGI